MKVRFKKLSEKAVMPRKAHATDAGLDLVATSRVFDKDGKLVYGTGLAVEIPEGYVGLLFPRSSVARKDLQLSNGVGVIDSGYRGEIMLKFNPALVYVDKGRTGKDATDYQGSDETDMSLEEVTFHGRSRKYPDVEDGFLPFAPRVYEVGERVGQLVILPCPEIETEEADTLSESERGEGGYGSSGM